MYKVGQKVIHRRNGVATIFNFAEMNGRQYYIVRIVRGGEENIYVPVLGAENIIRPVMDIPTADALLSSLAKVKKEFNPNTKQRRDAYKKILSLGDIKEIAYLYRQNYLYSIDPADVKLGAADIDMLNHAKMMILDELCITYSINPDKIEDYILSKIK